MGYSIQDIDTRLAMVEDKVDFIMQAFTVNKKVPSIISPGDFVVQTMTLKEVYRELKSQGAEFESQVGEK